MTKYIALIIVTFIITTGLCGCTTNNEEQDLDVFFESSVTNLLNYTLEFNKDSEDNIVEVTVTGIIENKVDRIININITVEFYDGDDNYINDVIYRIDGLRIKPNNGYSTTFSTKYNGENVDKTSYIKFFVDEI